MEKTTKEWLADADRRWLTRKAEEKEQQEAVYVNPWGRTVRNGVAETKKAEETTDATEGMRASSRLLQVRETGR